MAQMGMVVHAPKAKNDRIIDLFWFLTPNRTQEDMGRIQRYGTGIWRVEIPNTQWALYPMGGGISAGGAVITAWFFTAPFITAHVDASD